MIEREFIKVSGLRTAHIVIGEGEPVLMLHGWGANIDLVFPLAEQLEKKGFRCYIPDLPGFGETSPPPEGWAVHDYVRYILTYMDAHNLENCYLFGHSFGGRLGLVLGAEHGGRINKMVLADAAGLRAKTPTTTQIRLGLYKSIRDGLKNIGLEGVSEALREAYNNRYGSADFQNATGAMRETFVKVVKEDLREYAQRVQPSTLLLWGDRDEDTPLWQGRELERLIPDAGLVVYEGAGHYSYLDRLHEAVQVIAYFFKE